MPLQNRVTPYGAIERTSARGTLLGNRGCLHDKNQNVVKTSARLAWIICTLTYKDVRRPLMSPGAYTELFFLDEATALAAGHRPCAKCRREKANEFVLNWNQGNRVSDNLAAIDKTLGTQRWASSETPVGWLEQTKNLTSGVFFNFSQTDTDCYLYFKGKGYRWSHEGYSSAISLDPSIQVTVITPRATARAISQGYQPMFHPSLSALL